MGVPQCGCVHIAAALLVCVVANCDEDACVAHPAEDEGFSALQRRDVGLHAVQRGPTTDQSSVIDLSSLDGDDEALRVLRKAAGLELLTYQENWKYYRTLQKLAPTRVRLLSARRMFPFIGAFEGPGTKEQRAAFSERMAKLTCGGEPCDIPIVHIGASVTDDAPPPSPLRTNEPAEVLVAGLVHGDETLGVQVVAEVARLLAFAGAGPGEVAEFGRRLLGEGAGIAADALDQHASPLVQRELAYLAERRSVWLLPFSNPFGFVHGQREELGVDPNRDAPYQQGSRNEGATDQVLTCMQTLVTRTLNALFTSHLFHSFIQFHGGTRAMVYSWAGPNHVLVGTNGETAYEADSLERDGAPKQTGGPQAKSIKSQIIAAALNVPEEMEEAEHTLSEGNASASSRSLAEASLHSAEVPLGHGNTQGYGAVLGSHPPDWAALRQVARRMQLAAGRTPDQVPGRDNGEHMWYPTAREHSTDIYWITGGIQDWSYAGSWEPGVLKGSNGSRAAVCPGTDPKRTNYGEGGAPSLRVLSYLVEADNVKKPRPEQLIHGHSGQATSTATSIGADLELYKNRDDQGLVARNSRSLLALFEMAVPSVRMDMRRGVWYGAGCGIMDAVRVWDVCGVSDSASDSEPGPAREASQYRLLRTFSTLPCSGLHLWAHDSLEDKALGGAPDLSDEGSQALLGRLAAEANDAPTFPGEQKLADLFFSSKGGAGDDVAANRSETFERGLRSASALLLHQPHCLAFEAVFDQHWASSPEELGINPRTWSPNGTRPQALSVKARVEEEFEIQTPDGRHRLASSRTKVFFPAKLEAGMEPSEFQGGWKEAGLPMPPAPPVSS